MGLHQHKTVNLSFKTLRVLELQAIKVSMHPPLLVLEARLLAQDSPHRSLKQHQEINLPWDLEELRPQQDSVSVLGKVRDLEAHQLPLHLGSMAGSNRDFPHHSHHHHKGEALAWGGVTPPQPPDADGSGQSDHHNDD